jgi:hypothetical protein
MRRHQKILLLQNNDNHPHLHHPHGYYRLHRRQQ